MKEPCTVTNFVIEISVRGGPWGTWPEELGDDEIEAQEAFLHIRRPRYDPANSRARAVVIDEVASGKREDGTLDITAGRQPS
jgi:hypothetical protein